MKQRVISLMLTVAMGATLLAGCGSSATDSANAGADSGKESAAAAGTESDEKDFSGEGKVINIYSWNDEFRTRLEAVSGGGIYFLRRNGNNAEGWNRDSLGDQSESGWCLSAEAG